MNCTADIAERTDDGPNDMEPNVSMFPTAKSKKPKHLQQVPYLIRFEPELITTLPVALMQIASNS
jgi:hypothetical protein